MQPLSRTSTAGTTYTAAQVTGFLQSPALEENWAFDLLDANLNYVLDLSPYVDYKTAPTITHDSTAAIKRSLSLRLRGDVPINPLVQCIRPHYQLLAPDGGWLDWVLGTFLLNPPEKTISEGYTWLTVNGYDLSQLLADSCLLASLSAPASTSYLGIIQQMASGYGGQTPLAVQAIIDPTKVLPATLNWDAGTSRLQVVNDILAAVNNFPIWPDEMGVLRTTPIPDYNQVQPSFTFDTTSQSMVTGTLSLKPDISKAFNQFLVIIEDARRTPPQQYFLYQNTSPASSVAVQKWHPKTKVIKDASITDVTTAVARAQTEAQAASRIYQPLTVNTLPWPLSQDNDVYQLDYQATDEGLVISAYIEEKWSHRCTPGLTTEHVLVPVVAGV